MLSELTLNGLKIMFNVTQISNFMGRIKGMHMYVTADTNMKSYMENLPALLYPTVTMKGQIQSTHTYMYLQWSYMYMYMILYTMIKLIKSLNPCMYAHYISVAKWGILLSQWSFLLTSVKMPWLIYISLVFFPMKWTYC